MLYFILCVCVLICVAFVTLLERKILGYLQNRKGPNKSGFMGILQPVADAVKLFSREKNNSWSVNMIIFKLIPLFSLCLILIFWVTIFIERNNTINYRIIGIMVISSIGVYIILWAGWASNSRYAILGAYRGVAQTISYEVSFSFIILRVLLFGAGFSLNSVRVIQFNSLLYLFGLWNMFLLWLVTILAETRRTPFDFSEGESELVSGFNVEYGAGGFAVLFIAEYGNIIFMSGLTRNLFIGGLGFMCWKSMVVLFFILWVRGTLVRYRYDTLIIIAWKLILPYRLFILFISVNFNLVCIKFRI